MTPSRYMEGSHSSASTLAPSSPSSSSPASSLVPSSPSSSPANSLVPSSPSSPPPATSLIPSSGGCVVVINTFASHLFAHSWLLSRQSLVQKKSKEQPVGGGISASTPRRPPHTLQPPPFD